MIAPSRAIEVILNEARATAAKSYGGEAPPEVVAALVTALHALAVREATVQALYDAASQIARAKLGTASEIAAIAEDVLYHL